MEKIKEQIRDIASQYGLQIIYAFGSRAKEALDLVEAESNSSLRLRPIWI